jgi:glycosyltransferase involved in cell wall biosynthesis
VAGSTSGSSPIHTDIATVIPVYNHAGTVGRVVTAILACDLHCVLVDDGSDQTCAEALMLVAGQHGPDKVTLVRLPRNLGKGAAVVAGLRHLQGRGYTQVLQIDADGQHDLQDLPRFIDVSRRHPTAVVIGTPLYDDSVPRARIIGRYATHVWVWINTLSLEIRDSMCGFRVYPLAPAIDLASQVALGRRMDFDTEILVRLHWRGLAFVNLPTRVTYPRNGISHFRLLHDNLLISRMHARLFGGMLLRLPLLLWRKLRR